MSNMDYKDIFAERLKGIMDERDMSIGDLVAESGLPNGTIKSWIYRSQRSCPRADSLAILCDMLSVSMDYLFGRSEEL